MDKDTRVLIENLHYALAAAKSGRYPYCAFLVTQQEYETLEMDRAENSHRYTPANNQADDHVIAVFGYQLFKSEYINQMILLVSHNPPDPLLPPELFGWTVAYLSAHDEANKERIEPLEGYYMKPVYGGNVITTKVYAERQDAIDAAFQSVTKDLQRYTKYVSGTAWYGGIPS